MTKILINFYLAVSIISGYIFIFNIFAVLFRKAIIFFIGYKLYFYIFGWLGLILHEISHMIMCKIFRHKIISFKLLSLDSGFREFGYVNFTHDKYSIYQITGLFFVGVSPIITGCLVIFYSGVYLVPELFIMHTYASLNSFMDSIAEHLARWHLWVFLYISISVISGMAMSRNDINISMKGFFIIFLIVNIILILFAI